MKENMLIPSELLAWTGTARNPGTVSVSSCRNRGSGCCTIYFLQGVEPHLQETIERQSPLRGQTLQVFPHKTHLSNERVKYMYKCSCLKNKEKFY